MQVQEIKSAARLQLV